MAEGQRDLRIFCICGQKMKVPDAMMGRNGKCIACRQKIRIPSESELPEGERVIYLRDHPEFLRAAPRERAPEAAEAPEPPPRAEPMPDAHAAMPTGEASAEDGIDDLTDDSERLRLQFTETGEAVADEAEEGPGFEVAIGDARLSTVPLDRLDILRTLCSLREKAERHREAMGRLEGGDEAAAERRDLDKALARIDNARAALDEELRQRLMEIAIELSDTEKKLADVTLAGQMGDLGYDAYREQAEKLRRRRDILERRQHNLRGWLATQDPYLAGGPVDVALDSVPGKRFRITFTGEPPETQALLDWHIQELRAALQLRESADRRGIEAEKLGRAGLARSGAGIGHLRQELGAERKQAEARIAFVRDRLTQLRTDYGADREAIQTHLEQAESRYERGDLDRRRFVDLEKRLRRTGNDLTLAIDVITRALGAIASRDVPHPHGTFLQRIARTPADVGLGLDPWVAWLAGPLLLITLWLPLAGGESPFSLWRAGLSAGDAPWPIFAWPLAGACLVSLSALIPARHWRGRLLFILFAALALPAAWHLNDLLYRLTPLGFAFRAGPPYVLQPAFLLYAAATLLTGVAAWVALWMRRKKESAVVAAGVLVVTAVSALALADFAGLRVARPAIAGVAHERTGVNPRGAPLYRLEAEVANTGARPALLAPLIPESAPPNAWQAVLERETAPGGWEPVPPASPVMPFFDEPNTAAALDDAPAVPAGGTLALAYAGLPPGDYRFLLLNAEGDGGTVDIELASAPGEGDAPARPGARPADATPAPPQTPSDAEAPPPRPLRPNEAVREALSVRVELRGIVSGEDVPPVFLFTVHRPDGTSIDRRLAMGESIYGEWRVSEFNREKQTVTLRNEDDLLIVRSGEEEPLPSTPAGIDYDDED